MTISGAWERIETWLRDNASASHASLPGPASLDELRTAQAQIGLSFPAELTGSLRCHNGSGDFVLPVYHRFSDLRLIVRDYQRYRRAEEKLRRRNEERHRDALNQTAPPPRREYYYWNPAWIPFACDESGNTLFISQVDDDTFGRIGVHDKEDGPSFGENPRVHLAAPPFGRSRSCLERRRHRGLGRVGVRRRRRWPSGVAGTRKWRVTWCGTCHPCGRTLKSDRTISRWCLRHGERASRSRQGRRDYRSSGRSRNAGWPVRGRTMRKWWSVVSRASVR
ncbi:SMI1/KNR4 family protein [Streptomyces sp. NY05-11A]|uniref:SMI1/KNR4 family protein n=1 Tax=Streptomyces soliscabiei TaxID=588897 RepID=UPI0039F6F537